MATTEELFEEMENNPDIYLNSDEYCMLESDTSRVVVVPERWKTLGVEHDNDVERIPFKLPKIVGDNKDLSSFNIRINFINANNNTDSYTVDDIETTSDGDYITFTWLLKEYALYSQGTIGFVVYAYKGEEKWHTTLNKDCKCLVGLNVGESIVEKYPDIVEEILTRLDDLEKSGGITPEQIQTAVDDYLSRNPITPGATEEQARQIETNSRNIETKLNKNQGEENNGKILGINETGEVVPIDSPSGGGTEIPGKDGREIELQNSGTAIQWRYVGEEDWKDIVQLSELKGKDGDPGSDGKSATIRIGNVSTGEAGTQVSVQNTGTETNAVFDFSIPRGGKGDPGDNGITPTIGENGNWYIGEEDTGKPSRGENGNGIPKGGTTGQVLVKKSNSDYDTEWKTQQSGGSGDIPDIDEIRNRTYLIEIPDTKELTIAENREEILQTVKDGKYKFLNILDGIKHWNAPESKYNYPQKLKVEYIRCSEFYANMWLPNELNCHQSLRYKVNTNGTIKYDNMNDKSDLTAVLQWGILMLGDGKNYPTETIHFNVSNFKALGFNSKSRNWELIHENYPTGSMFNIEGTVADEDTVDIPGINIGNGFYSFEIPKERWHNSKGNPMCFHFFPKTGISSDVLKSYENIIVAFEISIQEQQYDSTFVVMSGADAYGSSTMEEALYSRFMTVRPYAKLINATSVLESESYKYVYSTKKLYDLLYVGKVNSGSTGGGGGGDSEEHTELEYCNLDGKCYFDTGILPNLNTNFEIKCNPEWFDTSYICGINDGVYKYGVTGTDNWYVVRGTVTSQAKSTAYWSQDWTIKQEGTKVSFNDTVINLDSTSALSPSGNFYVGNMSDGSGGAKGANGMKGKLYYAKMYSGSVLIFDAIPVKKNDGTLCLYDKIGKKYLLNKGSGNVE